MLIKKLSELLVCPNCGKDFRFSADSIECSECGLLVPIINENIFQFQKSDISEKTLEKTMYGPECDELRDELQNSRCENLLLNFKKEITKNPISLDYGCGSSRQVFDLAKEFHSDIAVGLDYDLKPLQIASQIAKELNFDNIFFIQHSSEKLPFKDKSFDIVTSHQSFEHIKNPELASNNISRTMRRGGFFEVDFPNGNSIGEYLREIFHKLTRKSNPHISHINLDQCQRMFASSGFDKKFFVATQAITGPMIYFFEGFILRFVLGKYKIWKMRKKIKNSSVFKIINKLEQKITRTFPKFGHDFRFVLMKK